MNFPRVRSLASDQWLRIGGGAGSVVVALLLFTRYSINGTLSRDEAIYAYGGQQFSHGVAPYDSIFDPKGPGATMIAGFAAWVAHLFGRNDIYAIRLMFLLFSLLTVLAIYVLALQLWGSVFGAVTAAVIFATFRGFAADAIAGPDAKTPGIFFAVTCMWLLVRRQWYAAAVFASLAVLVWQPLLIFPIVSVVLAVVFTPGPQRWWTGAKTLGFALLPLVVVSGYFLIAGAFGRFVESAFTFPLVGVTHGNETYTQRLHRIGLVVDQYYKGSGRLFWVGVILLVLLVAVLFVRHRSDLRKAWSDPLFCVVFVTALANFGYATTDFQGYPDVYPLLPYAALGLGGTVAVGSSLFRSAATERAVAAVATIAALVFAGLSWGWFGSDIWNTNTLRDQRADACAVSRITTPTDPLWSLGDPAPLVVGHVRNPDRFIYLGSGVDLWKMSHDVDGFAGWTAQIAAVHPNVVVLQGWPSKTHTRMGLWLRSAGYRPTHLGRWFAFVSPQGRQLAKQHGVLLGKSRPAATGPRLRRLPAAPCGKP